MSQQLASEAHKTTDKGRNRHSGPLKEVLHSASDDSTGLLNVGKWFTDSDPLLMDSLNSANLNVDFTARLVGEDDPDAFSRSWVLLLFCALSTSQGLAWLTFAPISKHVKRYYSPNIDDVALTLLDAWGPIVYLPGAFLVMWMLTRPRGLRHVVLFSSTCSVLGSGIRVLSTIDPADPWSVVFLHIGQILNAAVGPGVIGCPSLLSALWFTSRNSALATAAGVLSNNAGNALAYLIGPQLLPLLGMRWLLLGQFLFSLTIAAAAFTYFPHAPQRPQNATSVSLRCGANSWEELEERSETANPVSVLLREIVAFLKVPSAALLSLVYAWSSGSFVAWTSMLSIMLTNNAVNPELESNKFIGWMTFGSTVAYIVGGILMSWMVDNYFSRRMKTVLMVNAMLSTLSAFVFMLATPSNLIANPELSLGRIDILIVVAFCGLFNGAAAPIYYELAAEVAFPVSEGTSGNVLSFFENIGALVQYLLMMYVFPQEAMNVVFASGMFTCCIFLAFCKESYNRKAVEVAATEAVREGSEGPTDILVRSYLCALATSPRDRETTVELGGDEAKGWHGSWNSREMSSSFGQDLPHCGSRSSRRVESLFSTHNPSLET